MDKSIKVKMQFHIRYIHNQANTLKNDIEEQQISTQFKQIKQYIQTTHTLTRTTRHMSITENYKNRLKSTGGATRLTSQQMNTENKHKEPNKHAIGCAYQQTTDCR
jgi:hypothetical protein